MGTYQIDNIKFAVRILSKDPLNMQLSEIYPYPVTDYIWAHVSDRRVLYYGETGLLICSHWLQGYTDKEWADLDEYIDYIIDKVCSTLKLFNKDVYPNDDQIKGN